MTNNKSHHKQQKTQKPNTQKQRSIPNDVEEETTPSPATTSPAPVQAPPDPPFLTLTQDQDIIHLSWTVPNSNGSPITQYLVTEITPNTHTSPTTNTYHFVKNTKPEFYYKFHVQAVSSLGKSLPSNEVEYGTKPLPLPTLAEQSCDVMLSIHCGSMLKHAYALKDVLENHGYSVFLCDLMKAGKDFRDEISRNASLSRAFVPFMNLQWCKSGECEYEFKIALRNFLTKKSPLILPIILEDFKVYDQYYTVGGVLCQTNGVVAKPEDLGPIIWDKIVGALESGHQLLPSKNHPNPTSPHPNPPSPHPNPTSPHPNPPYSHPNTSPSNDHQNVQQHAHPNNNNNNLYDTQFAPHPNYNDPQNVARQLPSYLNNMSLNDPRNIPQFAPHPNAYNPQLIPRSSSPDPQMYAHPSMYPSSPVYNQNYIPQSHQYLMPYPGQYANVPHNVQNANIPQNIAFNVPQNYPEANRSLASPTATYPPTNLPTSDLTPPTPHRSLANPTAVYPPTNSPANTPTPPTPHRAPADLSSNQPQNLPANPPSSLSDAGPVSRPKGESEKVTKKNPNSLLTTVFPLEIPFAQLTGLELIAAGTFGKISSAKYRGEAVAVKVVANSMDLGALQEFKHEAETMSKLRSRYIVNLFGVCTESPNIGIVMELMEGGSLNSLLRKREIELTWATKLGMAEEIARGIKVLHSSKPTVVHRDLKSANIMLDDRQHCKITDFGFAIIKNDSSTRSGLQSMGTLAWMAPELFSLRPKYSTKSDIYAYGMIMWEIATRETPYKGADTNLVQAEVKKGFREELPAEKNCPPGYLELLERCWHQEPAKRPDVDTILAEIEKIKEKLNATNSSTYEEE